jgi:hypothetical protein
MLENPLDDLRVLDAGDHAQLSAAAPADLDVEANTRFRRCAQVRERCRALADGSPQSLASWAAAARVPGTTWGFGTSAARRAMKSSGSKITCVVPSRYDNASLIPDGF